MQKIFNGDIYDIGQTVNGVSKFIYYNDRWFYYREDMTREYEYTQEDLTALIENVNEVEYITYIGNIFHHLKT